MTRLTFNEFEAFAESVQEASMTMRITALSEPRWTLQYEIVGSLRLQKGYEGGGNVTEGITFGDAWTFYHQQHLPVHANGQIANADEVFVAPPNTEFCLACRPAHGWLTVAIPTSQLFPTERELEFADSITPQVLKPGPDATRRFSSLVERFLSAAELHPELLDFSIALDSFQSELLAAAQGLFARCQARAACNFLRWRGHVKSTVERASSHANLSLSISDLAGQIGVPERTLRTAFQKCYGLSPVEFLRIHRLNQARQKLRVGSPDETSVTQIAFGLGFWDLGRFAGAYRRLFGELPSETLRKPYR